MQQTSPTGDTCHYNLVDVSEKEARTLLKKAKLDDFNICSDNGIDRPLTEADVSL